MQIENLFLIIGAVIIALLIAVFHYFYKSNNNGKVSYLLTFLRFISLFALFLLLLNLQVEQTEVETIKPTLVVAVDNSSSIANFKQEDEVKNAIKDLKNDTELNEKFDIDYFSFSNDVKTLDSLKFDKTQTNISKPLLQFNELYKDRIAPVLLISDGNQTYGSDYEYSKFTQPVFSIVVGDTVRYSDLKISQLNANKYTYLKNKFPVEVFLNYEGDKTVSSQFSVYKGKQKVFSKKLEFSPSNSSQNIEFYLPANEVGTHYYSARIDYLQNEKNTINNNKNFVVEVISEQSNVLILSSFLHPDIGALKKSIESNKQRKVTLMRSTDTYKLEEYQTVVLYQPTNSFQKVFAELKSQKINYFIITGSKTDWNFLNIAQDNFEKKAINQTENYGPIFNPIFGGFVVEDIGVDTFSPLVDKFGEVTFNIPFETLLYQKIGNFPSEQPLLATFDENDRRGVVLLGENSWRWRMTSFVESQSFQNYDELIGKIIQYLSVNKKEQRLTIDYNSFYYSNDEVKILANYLDKNYVFDSNASMMLSLKNRETNDIKRMPFSLRGNRYQVELSGLKKGNYSFSVTVNNQNVKSNGSFKILNFSVEQQHTTAQIDKLSSISRKSGGKLFYLDNLENLRADLIEDKRFISKQKSEKKQNSIIEWKWLLGLILVSLSIEWIIRKYNGLI